MERTSISPRQADCCRGDGRAKQQILNITDPALGKGNAQQDEKWMLFSLKILSPSHIQQIRLRERFKKILTRTKKKLLSHGRGWVEEGGREQFVIQWLQAIHHRNWVSNAASCESLLPCQRFNTLHWECKSCLKFGTNCTASTALSPTVLHILVSHYTRVQQAQSDTGTHICRQATVARALQTLNILQAEYTLSCTV